jgi:uncharacterized membrane protein
MGSMLFALVASVHPGLVLLGLGALGIVAVGLFVLALSGADKREAWPMIGAAACVVLIFVLCFLLG